MKDITVALDDAIAARAEAKAASRGESLSEFVQKLIEREIGRAIECDGKTDLEVMREFLRGPGYPGISKNWRGERRFMMSVWMSLNVAVNATIRATDNAFHR
jgi:hypothetical protein